MNGDFPSDVFSAYFDDEATLAERAEVERRLMESPATQEFLSDLEQISTDLQHLPRWELPGDLTARVLAAAEREMLIPANLASATSENGFNPASATQTPKRRVWLYRVLPAAATAAALLLSWHLLGPQSPDVPENSDRQANSVAVTPADTDGTIIVALKEPPPSNNRIAGAPGVPHRNIASVTGERNGELRGAVFDSLHKDAAYSEPLVPPVVLWEGSTSATHGGSEFIIVDDLRKLTQTDVGRVVTAIENTDSGVAVVRLTVVDYNKGFDALQILLTRNAIQRHPGVGIDASGLTRDQSSAAKSKNAAGSERLIAIYVQSTSDRLSTALAELKADIRFQSLEAGQSLAATQFDDDSKRQMAMLGDGTGLSPLESFEPMRSFRQQKSETVRALPAPSQISSRPPARSRFGQKGQEKNDDGQSSPGRLAAGAAGAGKSFAPNGGAALRMKRKSAEKQQTLAEFDRISRQLQLAVPAELLQRNVSNLVARRRQAAGDKKSFTDSFQFGGAAGPSGLPAKPVRVLFVVVCPQDDRPREPEAKKPAAVPPRKPAPSRPKGAA